LPSEIPTRGRTALRVRGWLLCARDADQRGGLRSTIHDPRSTIHDPRSTIHATTSTFPATRYRAMLRSPAALQCSTVRSARRVLGALGAAVVGVAAACGGK